MFRPSRHCELFITGLGYLSLDRSTDDWAYELTSPPTHFGPGYSRKKVQNKSTVDVKRRNQDKKEKDYNSISMQLTSSQPASSQLLLCKNNPLLYLHAPL